MQQLCGRKGIADFVGHGTGHFEDGGPADLLGQLPFETPSPNADPDPNEQFIVVKRLCEVIVGTFAPSPSPYPPCHSVPLP